MMTSPLRAQRVPRPMPRILVVGLGNPFRGDDGVGLHVVQRLRQRLTQSPNVVVEEDYRGGLGLMERMIGFDRAVVIDAIRSGSKPGTVRVLPQESMPTRHGNSIHDLDVSVALALGRTAGVSLPADGNIRFVAVEAADVETFSQACTPTVERAIHHAVDAVLRLLASWR